MDHLKLEGFGATGTIRNNCIEKAPLTEVKAFAKKAQDTYELLQDFSLGMLLVHWNDNSVVTLATNCHSATSILQAKR